MPPQPRNRRGGGRRRGGAASGGGLASLQSQMNFDFDFSISGIKTMAMKYPGDLLSIVVAIPVILYLIPLTSPLTANIVLPSHNYTSANDTAGEPQPDLVVYGTGLWDIPYVLFVAAAVYAVHEALRDVAIMMFGKKLPLERAVQRSWLVAICDFCKAVLNLGFLAQIFSESNDFSSSGWVWLDFPTGMSFGVKVLLIVNIAYDAFSTNIQHYHTRQRGDIGDFSRMLPYAFSAIGLTSLYLTMHHRFALGLLLLSSLVAVPLTLNRILQPILLRASAKKNKWGKQSDLKVVGDILSKVEPILTLLTFLGGTVLAVYFIFMEFPTPASEPVASSEEDGEDGISAADLALTSVYATVPMRAVACAGAALFSSTFLIGTFFGKRRSE